MQVYVDGGYGTCSKEPHKIGLIRTDILEQLRPSLPCPIISTIEINLELLGKLPLGFGHILDVSCRVRHAISALSSRYLQGVDDISSDLSAQSGNY